MKGILEELREKGEEAKEEAKQGRFEKAADIYIEAIKKSFELVGPNDCFWSYAPTSFDSDQRKIHRRAEGFKTKEQKEEMKDGWDLRKNMLMGLNIVIGNLKEEEKEKYINFFHKLLKIPMDENTVEWILHGLKKFWNQETVKLIPRVKFFDSILSTIIADDLPSIPLSQVIQQLEEKEIAEIYIPYGDNEQRLWLLISEIFRSTQDSGIKEYLISVSENEEPEWKKMAARGILKGKKLKTSSIPYGSVLQIEK